MFNMTYLYLVMLEALRSFWNHIWNSRQIQIQKEADQIRKDFETHLEQSYKVIVQQRSQNQSIGKPKKIKILNSTATELVEMLNEGSTTSYELMMIFIEQVYFVGKKFNLITDQMFKQAISTAKEYDKVRKESGKKNWTFGENRENCLPPFYGIPLSVKESLRLKGKLPTLGLVRGPNVVCQEDGLFLMMAKQMGFIPFVRSNIPQVNKSFEAHNNIHGRSVNPWNVERTVGGSSGGQAGLLCCGGSVFGTGSDIGGSCRIPSAFCGTLSLMCYRYSKRGDAFYGDLAAGILNYKSSMCPMTRSVEDLALFLHEMVRPENYDALDPHFVDPYARIIPFNLDVYKDSKPLKIGYLKHFPIMRSSPSYGRAIDECLEVLRANGHQVKEVQIPYADEAVWYFSKILLCDGKYRIVGDVRNGERVSAEYAEVERLARLPNFIKKISIYILEKLGEKRLAKLFRGSFGLSMVEYLKVTSAFEYLKLKFNEHWVDQQIDVLLLPGFTIPACKHTQSKDLLYTLAFTTIWNMMEYSSGSLPITQVKWHEEFYTDTYNDRVTKTIKDSLINSRGMPINVQVASRPGSEQKILRVMREIEKGVDFRYRFAYPIPTDHLT